MEVHQSEPPQALSMGKSGSPPSTGCEECTTYLGRSEYLGGNIRIDEDLAKNYEDQRGAATATQDLRILELYKAFDMPPRLLRNSLIDNLMKNCIPWMPIVDRADFEGEPSPLLLQAAFLAGSRLGSAPLAYASCEELYQRAKALALSGYEKDTLTVIRAICLMQWFNPTGPEHISLDKSSFWLRIGVGLAYEIGLHREPSPGKDASLRRRLWWSLFTRDCVISAGQGRPRTINMQDCCVRPISLDDFPVKDKNAHLFIAYVQIYAILADLTECCVRKSLSPAKKVGIEAELKRWVKELPPCLQMYRQHPLRCPAPYDLEVRQLHIPYLTILTILNRPTTPASVPLQVALLSSSLVAGIFEDFLARDDIRYLGPTFTFHIFVASFPQLLCHKYPVLWQSAEQELKIMQLALHELRKTWPSAIGPQKIIQSFIDAVVHEPSSAAYPHPPMTADQTAFFEAFGPEFCRKWDLVSKASPPPALDPAMEPMAERSVEMTVESMSPVPCLPDQGGRMVADSEAFDVDPAGNWLYQDWLELEAP
ncbi:uncharacterized protein PV07_09077 [Cladophialophora immunda]|uniref:Xylanolytic transcriptional activator regulatory domain-containing protein n=1 Tax=Cladophialophora immunda TaxID=569365 RepID=A0A0D2C422_9EURO|nr:uncharacterized protein PV07_09077 [Cladophialophora immunda]KIW25943.1 hypothetical protein PV07_09077 [Cladophialophora immunda]